MTSRQKAQLEALRARCTVTVRWVEVEPDRAQTAQILSALDALIAIGRTVTPSRLPTDFIHA
jgi:hypothetical protein